MAEPRLGLPDKAILDSVENERRGKLEELGSEKSLRKLKSSEKEKPC